MPLKYLETLRGLNEVCSLPLILAGEERLISKLESEPRLKSRIRKPEIAFKPLDLVDVATYYSIAAGIDLSDVKS